MELLPRAVWTGTPRPVDKLSPNDPTRLKGFGVHYTGSTTPLGSTPTLAESCARLEAERKDHVDGRGWSDIAYSAAADQAGRLFDCRGVDWECAANGDQDVNHSHGAITVLVGAGDRPTPAAVDAVRWWRQHAWLPRWPRATAVVGHRDLHQTDCPGDPLYALVKSGAFLQPPSIAEDDMQLSELAGWDVGTLIGLPPKALNFQTLITRVYAATVLHPADPEALAEAIAKHLPAGSGVDARALAGAVADDLAARLQA